MTSTESRARWFALAVVCAGSLMNVLDTTIVGVALPSIRQSLAFSPASLAWVVNAYLITYGGFLLLGGRLGDLYGHRRLFTAGIAVFTLASLACGLATGQGMLITARAVQGFGGAVASAVALSLVVSLFTEPRERATAMGVFGFIAAGGGSIGVLLGGVLTDLLSWHWIFLVNVPIGVAVCIASLRVLPARQGDHGHGSLDVTGAVLVTGALMLAVYAIVNAGQAGWLSGRTTAGLAGAAVLLAAFGAVEARASSPLIPLRLFRLRNLAVANVVGVLWTAAMFAWFFLSSLYLQLVLHYSPLQVGLAFLPANLIMGGLSLGLSARVVTRFGIRAPVGVGLLLAATGLVLLARAPVGGHFLPDVLPGMMLLGLAAGVAFNPVLLAATSDVRPADAGLASGVVNTSFMMGGALGLAVLAGLAASRTSGLLASGHDHAAALAGGYHAAFLAGAALAAVAALLGARMLRQVSPAACDEPSAQQIGDRGDARLDRTVADLAESHDELRRRGRVRGPELAHAVQADQPLSGGRDHGQFVRGGRQVRDRVESRGQAGQPDARGMPGERGDEHAAAAGIDRPHPAQMTVVTAGLEQGGQHQLVEG
jgi:EmrB/QacA subfamily drug resistance transporter